ncbi:MAG: Na/Pi cotransporter family protein [Spirochaetaceae bacterium]|nr:Na/Pi cotransporter family protein [Spirochaetaceae bacterium]
MSMWDVFCLIGGLAIFLYGIIAMNKNLTAIAGEKMKSVMLTLTKSRPRGYATGVGITMINQSSSATTVLEVALVSAGLMTFYQSIAVTMGAELGSTFLPHIMAFPKISKFAPIIIGIGFFASLILKKQRSINIALVFLGFGLLFLGLDMMSGSVDPLKHYPPFLDFMTKIEAPILGILFGLMFTLVVQSAGATCGLTIAMAMSGAITLEQALPINIGASIGTVLTALLASLALTWDAKRTAFWHVFSQLIGAVIVFALLLIRFDAIGGERLYIWLTKWVTAVVFRTDDLARQIAVGFTLIPLIKCILLFGIPKLLDGAIAVFEKMFCPRETEKPFGVTYLQEQLVDSNVDIALEMAKKEILISADLVKNMLEKVDMAFKSKDIKLVNEIRAADLKVDILHKAIIIFLAKVAGKELGEGEAKKSMNYLYIENELESIGDVIDKELMAIAKKMIDLDLSFSEQGSYELTELHGRVRDNVSRMIEAFTEEDIGRARKIISVYADIEEKKYQLSHIDRLNQGVRVSLDSSSAHLDVISSYARINDHIVAIAKRIIWLTKERV